MGSQEFRAILDWWMCSDPFPRPVNREIIDSWLTRESQERGYESIVDAYHRHDQDGVD